jgi:hypothetical protein
VTTPTTTKQAVELPDDIDIEGGLNYETHDPCKPINPVEGYRYFAAAKDTDPTRPDNVAACKRMGYEVCAVEKIDSEECVLMRMPQERWDRINRARINRANAMALSTGKSIQGVPEESTHRIETHGKTRQGQKG